MTNHGSNKNDEEMVDSLFRIAKNEKVSVTSEFFDRIISDAENVVSRQSIYVTPHSSWFTRVFKTVGGWRAIGSMVAATVTGIWIGAGNVALVDNLGSTFTSVSDETYFSELFSEPSVLDEEEAG